MKVTVFGTGYIGLTQAAGLAEVETSVCCINVDAQRIEWLNSGHSPLFEPGIGRGRTKQT